MSVVPPRNWRPSTAAVALTALAGPGAAVLYELGCCEVLASSLGVGLPAAVGGVGAAVGALAIFRGSTAIGLLCFFANAAVLTLYGFLALFFTLGGSR
jgi:hypothetical protein